MNRQSRVFAFILASLLLVSAAARAAADDSVPADAPAASAPSSAALFVPEQITVLGQKPGLDKTINDFVKSYAAAPETLEGQFARWKSGICPAVRGLVPEQLQLVTERIKAIAAQIGAPVETRVPCSVNLYILFTPEPQKFLDQIRQKSAWMLGSHYKSQEKDLATVRSVIQAWYATKTEDIDGNLWADDAGNLSAACMLYIPSVPSSKGGLSGSMAPTFNAMSVNTCAHALGRRTGIGFRSEFSLITVVVDSGRTVGMPIRALTDYIAMLSLAQTKTFDGCRDLPSISNLFSSACDPSLKSNGLTVGDAAYLRAIYQMDPELGAQLQEANLAGWMKINLTTPRKAK